MGLPHSAQASLVLCFPHSGEILPGPPPQHRGDARIGQLPGQGGKEGCLRHLQRGQRPQRLHLGHEHRPGGAARLVPGPVAAQGDEGELPRAGLLPQLPAGGLFRRLPRLDVAALGLSGVPLAMAGKQQLPPVAGEHHHVLGGCQLLQGKGAALHGFLPLPARQAAGLSFACVSIAHRKNFHKEGLVFPPQNPYDYG